MRVMASLLVVFAWWLYVLEPMQVWQHGQQLTVWQWVARDRVLNRDFCEMRARDIRRRDGKQAVCRYLEE